MIEQLPPRSSRRLILQQRSQHRVVPLLNTRALGMILRKIAQQLRHSDSKPPIAAPPEERHIRSMEEQAVRLLKLVEIRRHLGCCTIKILLVPCRTERLDLH